MKNKTRKLIGRFIALLIILVLSLSLFSCAKTPAEDNAIPENLIEENNEQTEDQTEKTEDNTDNTPVIDTTNDEQMFPEQIANSSNEINNEEILNEDDIDKKGPRNTATEEVNFSDNTVIVTLTKKESRLNKTYTALDFSYLNVQSVSTLLSYYEDVDNRVMLSITLATNDKKKVLEAIDILENVDYVYSACPDYIFKIINQDERV